MSLTFLIFWIVALAILIGLGAYAWKLQKQLTHVQQLKVAEETQAAENLRKHQQELLQDIHFIARSVLSDQCEITEGVLRLQYLIKGLDPSAWYLKELQTIRLHYEATSHMPILEAYQALSRQEQFKLDNQRWQLEADHKSGIMRELQWLVTYRFNSVTLLQ